MWTAIISKPNGIGGATVKNIQGKTLRDIESHADTWGALRIEFMNGEVWRKIAGNWIVI